MHNINVNFVGESHNQDSFHQVKRRKLYNRDPTKKIPRQTTWYFKQKHKQTFGSKLGEHNFVQASR